MASYDNKLGEWFKQVEQRELELKEKKKSVYDSSTGDPVPITERKWQPTQEIQSAVVEVPVREASAAAVATLRETRAVVAETTRIEESRQVSPEYTSASMASAVVETPREIAPEQRQVRQTLPPTTLFDDSDIPQVEDFFSFLSHTEERAARLAEEISPIEFEEPEVFESEPAVVLDRLSEGTGKPRPISVEAEPQVFEAVATPAPVEVPRVVAPVVIERTAPAVIAQEEPKDAELQEKWDRIPHHLQTLFGGGCGEEVAQNSYKTFKESRGILIQRLLDPVISLEEAARVLNVCPTTVRRYTNRGVLKHLRTAGNQRRFRLSDVLTFMETNSRKARPAAE